MGEGLTTPVLVDVLRTIETVGILDIGHAVERDEGDVGHDDGESDAE